MSEAKYTKGPWGIYVIKTDDVVVRKMFPDCTECCQIARVNAGFADARLISAAPDLLEALQAMLEAFGKNGLGGEYDPGEVPAIDLALAATAKALGEQA